MEREEQQAERKTKQTRSRQVKKTHFFLGRHTTAAGREARMTEVEPQRPEAGSTTDPIAPTELAVGMRAADPDSNIFVRGHAVS